MVLAADYPFMDVLWSMLIFFCFFLWIWIAITCFADIFRRHDISGWGKTGWLIFTIVLPFLGVFIYLISQHDGMDQRNIERSQAERAQLDQYVRETAGGGGAAAEIDKAKQLLESGAINQSEYDALKQKALA